MALGWTALEVVISLLDEIAQMAFRINCLCRVPGLSIECAAERHKAVALPRLGSPNSGSYQQDASSVQSAYRRRSSEPRYCPSKQRLAGDYCP